MPLDLGRDIDSVVGGLDRSLAQLLSQLNTARPGQGYLAPGYSGPRPPGDISVEIDRIIRGLDSSLGSFDLSALSGRDPRAAGILSRWAPGMGPDARGAAPMMTGMLSQLQKEITRQQKEAQKKAAQAQAAAVKAAAMKAAAARAAQARAPVAYVDEGDPVAARVGVADGGRE